MITLFNEDLTIIYQGLKRLIRWYEDSGPTGLFANYGSIEMYNISDQERLDLTSM